MSQIIKNENRYEVLMLADADGNVISPAAGGGSNVSTVNSTTTPLNAGESFTGEWEDVSSFNSLIVAPKTDQKGTFIIQFSPDGVNIDSSLYRYYKVGSGKIEPPHRFTITRQYVRIIFTNTSTENQTYLRLQTLYGQKENLNIPLDATMSRDYDAIATRPTRFVDEASLGRRQGVVTWNKWGFTDNLTQNVETTIWAKSGDTVRLQPLTTASVFDIWSDADSDTVGGNGLHGVTIYGVDSDRNEYTESITLNGQTKVRTSIKGLGINRISQDSCGSNFINVGNIFCQAVIDSSDQAYIPAGTGSTQQLFFFTANNHKGLATWLRLNSIKLSGGTQPTIQYKVYVWDFVKNTRTEVYRENIDTSVNNTLNVTPSQPFRIPEQSLIEITVNSNTTNTVARGRMSIIEYEDVDE